MNSTAKPTNSTAKAPNSTANGTKSTAKVTNSIAKTCIMNMNKWQISVLAKIQILLPFHLILTRGPIIIVKKNLRVVLS